MKILFQNNILRLLALSFCTVFLLQISLDIAFKLSEKNKKELILQQGETPDDDSSKDGQEKEKEKENDSENESKELNQLLLLSYITEINATTLEKHLKHSNLPSGFFKTFSPPPDQSNFPIS